MNEHAPRRTLEDRYAVTEGLIHLTGVQALARLPIDVRRSDQRTGLKTAAFVSGYEGSPLGGYDLELGRQSDLLAEHDVVFRAGVNEELAATAVQGAQLAAMSADKRVDGITGYWYGKSPGLDRAADALRHNNLMGTHPTGGALALVGDDPSAKSSTVPGSSEMLLADLGLPTLYPADPQEVLDLGLHAVALSRACGLWVGFKIATNVADGTGTAQVHPGRIHPIAPDPVIDGRPFTHEMTARMLQPDLGRLERSRDGARLELARRYAAANGLNTIVAAGSDDRIGIIAPGKTFHDLRQALRILGLDDAELARRGVRLLHLAMVHPSNRRSSAASPQAYTKSSSSRRSVPSSRLRSKTCFTAARTHQWSAANAAPPAPRSSQPTVSWIRTSSPVPSPPGSANTATSPPSRPGRRHGALHGREPCFHWPHARPTSARDARTTPRRKHPTARWSAQGSAATASS